MFDKFDCVFIDNGQDLKYKKVNWFLECQSFLYSEVKLQNFQAKTYKWFLNAGAYRIVLTFKSS